LGEDPWKFPEYGGVSEIVGRKGVRFEIGTATFWEKPLLELGK
jgi:hypothetical protein